MSSDISSIPSLTTTRSWHLEFLCLQNHKCQHVRPRHVIYSALFFFFFNQLPCLSGSSDPLDFSCPFLGWPASLQALSSPAPSRPSPRPSQQIATCQPWVTPFNCLLQVTPLLDGSALLILTLVNALIPFPWGLSPEFITLLKRSILQRRLASPSRGNVAVCQKSPSFLTSLYINRFVPIQSRLLQKKQRLSSLQPSPPTGPQLRPLVCSQSSHPLSRCANLCSPSDPSLTAHAVAPTHTLHILTQRLAHPRARVRIVLISRRVLPTSSPPLLGLT